MRSSSNPCLRDAIRESFPGKNSETSGLVGVLVADPPPISSRSSYLFKNVVGFVGKLVVLVVFHYIRLKLDTSVGKT